jgi:hypothetical protein
MAGNAWTAQAQGQVDIVTDQRRALEILADSSRHDDNQVPFAAPLDGIERPQNLPTVTAL